MEKTDFVTDIAVLATTAVGMDSSVDEIKCVVEDSPVCREYVSLSNNLVPKDLYAENLKTAKLDCAAQKQMQALESAASSCKLVMRVGPWRDRRFSK